MAQEYETEEPRESHGENAPISSTDFDHPNVELMNRYFLPTLNNELVKYGYIPSNDMPLVKSQISILKDLAFIAAGEVDARTGLKVESMAWTAERLVEKARDGFGAKIEKTEYINENLRQVGGKTGFFGAIKGALQRKKPAVMESGP